MNRDNIARHWTREKHTLEEAFGGGLAPLLLYFFFFLAEDGIRDRDVTGVQTCALPICCLRVSVAAPPPARPRARRAGSAAATAAAPGCARTRSTCWPRRRPVRSRAC